MDSPKATRQNYYMRMGGRYGFSLHENHSVSAIMNTDFLKVDGKATIDAVSNLAMNRPVDSTYDFIVVICNAMAERFCRNIITAFDALVANFTARKTSPQATSQS